MTSWALIDGVTRYDLPVQPAYGGAQWETLGVESVSLAGTTTFTRRAVKGRWSLPLTLMSDDTYARLFALYQGSAGPFWLYAADTPSMLVGDQRHIGLWPVGAFGAATDRMAKLNASVKVSMAALTGAPVSQLVPVKASMSYTAGLTIKGTGTITLAIRWYTAAGTFLSENTSALAAGASEAQQTVTATSPATAAYAQLTAISTTSTAFVTDPRMLGGLTPIPAWQVVILKDLAAEWVTHQLVVPTLTLVEV